MYYVFLLYLKYCLREEFSQNIDWQTNQDENKEKIAIYEQILHPKGLFERIYYPTSKEKMDLGWDA